MTTDRLSMIGLSAGVISLLISLLLLISCFKTSWFCDIEKTAGFWSIVVSAVALVVSCFFVILAFEAYKQVRVVSDLKRQIEEEQKSLVKSRENLAESMWDSYTLQLAVLGKLGKADSIANEIRHSRGKLGYLFPMMKDDQRMQCFDDLAKVGDREDIVFLYKILNSIFVTDEIKDKATATIKMIYSRE